MEAAGLVSSIITFIEFSCKLINGTVVVYKKTATGPAADSHISTVIHDLEDATEDMRNTMSTSPGQTYSHQRVLSTLAGNCNELSKDLIAILKDLERKADGSKTWRSLQASWKTLRKSDKITEMEQKLNTYRLQLLLRISLMLSEDEASVKAQLDQMYQSNVKSFGQTIAELHSVQEAMKELDTRLRLQADQARHMYVANTEQVDAFADIRGELSRITQMLDTIPRRAPADLQIIARLRFEKVYDRVEFIHDGDFDIFTSLLKSARPVSEREDITMAYYSSNKAPEHPQNTLNFWLGLGDKILHISGKAGSGKSTLMKLLSQNTKLNDELRAWAGSMKLVVASFFFWSAGDALQKSLEGLYRSILFEVLQQCPELTRKVFQKHWNEISTCEGFVGPERFPFRFSELKDGMSRLVEGVSGGSNYRFCFFIDGLDEFEGESMEHLELAKQLRQWAEFPYVKICASSRPHEEFHSVFDRCSRIDLHEITGPDILRFSRETLEGEGDGHLTSTQVEELARQIQYLAEGVFLWAHLVVRSLCKGILHLDTYETLQAKLDQTPRDLMKLFLHLFQKITPDDRTRAYQLLLLVADGGFPTHGNAIMVSWINDLQNPDFPYNIPRSAYTDEEVARRIKYAERQLKLTCNGLLEMALTPEIRVWSDIASDADVYFQHSVRFFHRTVRDFLKQPETISAIQEHLGGRTMGSSDILRLRLAEIKFARTYRGVFKMRGYSSRQLKYRFFAVCQAARMEHRVLKECERILEQYRKEPYSIPEMVQFLGQVPSKFGEMAHNDGIVAWGKHWSSLDHCYGKRESADDASLDISWIHFLAHECGSSDFVMDYLTSGVIGNSSDLCLVLSASVGNRCDSDILERLLDHGMQLSDRVALRYESSDVQYVTGWVAFLVLLGNQCGHRQNRLRTSRAPGKLFASLESLLRRRRASDLDVRMEYLRKPRHTMHPASWDESLPGCGPVHMTLEEIILCARPPNMDTLLREIQALKTWRGWVGHLASWTLRGASGWIPTNTAAVSSRCILSALDFEQAAFKGEAEYSDGYYFGVRRIWVGDKMYEIGMDPAVRVC